MTVIDLLIISLFGTIYACNLIILFIILTNSDYLLISMEQYREEFKRNSSCFDYESDCYIRK